MNKNDIAKIIESIIPQICRTDKTINWGRPIEINLDGDSFRYITYPSGGRGGDIGKIIDYIEDQARHFLNINLHSRGAENSYIQRQISSQWLAIRTGFNQFDWHSILDYIEKLENRTYENLPISMNLIIDTNAEGRINIADYKETKVLDVLGGTNYTYFVVDKNMRLVDYHCVAWNEAKDKNDYSSIPNFIQPFASKLERTNIGISLTHAGDTLFYNKEGLIATKRKGNWTIYENSFVKNLFRDILGGNTSGTPYAVKCNLFDLCWDLSYRRHGALIIVVDDNSFIKYIVNQESVLSNSNCNELRFDLNKAFQTVSLSEIGEIRNRSIFLELASVDGAIIVDIIDGKIKSFGSIIKTAEGIEIVSGARSTAAESAMKYDLMPIKISSDGDITLYKKAKDKVTGDDVCLRYTFY